jgi:hypothetical protein
MGKGRQESAGLRDANDMWRWLIIVMALYAGGHPALDAYRPAAFERSLREFHRDANRLARRGIEAATGLDQTRALRQFVALSGQLQSMLSAR